MKIFKIYKTPKEYFEVRGDRCTETTDGTLNIYRGKDIVFKLFTKNIIGVEILENNPWQPYNKVV